MKFSVSALASRDFSNPDTFEIFSKFQLFEKVTNVQILVMDTSIEIIIYRMQFHVDRRIIIHRMQFHVDRRIDQMQIYFL